MALCALPRHARASRQESRCVHTILQWLISSSQDKEVLSFNRVKGEEGAVGLTENPAALRRWMVAGPELSQMVEELEGNISSAEDHGHHGQKLGFQRCEKSYFLF